MKYTLYLRRPGQKVVVQQSDRIPKYSDKVTVGHRVWVVQRIVFNLPYPAVTVLLDYVDPDDT